MLVWQEDLLEWWEIRRRYVMALRANKVVVTNDVERLFLYECVPMA